MTRLLTVLKLCSQCKPSMAQGQDLLDIVCDPVANITRRDMAIELDRLGLFLRHRGGIDTAALDGDADSAQLHGPILQLRLPESLVLLVVLYG